jgi:uncharacterized membrane protein YdfJ with MMPL/SSD domain
MQPVNQLLLQLSTPLLLLLLLLLPLSPPEVHALNGEWAWRPQAH